MGPITRLLATPKGDGGFIQQLKLCDAERSAMGFCRSSDRFFDIVEQVRRDTRGDGPTV